MTDKITLGSIVGASLEEDFLEFDLTEIQQILLQLRETDAIDLAHTEFLQQQTLRAADILSEYLGKIIKTTSYLESKVSSAKNKASLEYTDPSGGKITAEMRKWAGECSPEAAKLSDLLAKAKGSKVVLEKKYDIILKSHHYYKDLTTGLRKTVLGQPQNNSNIPEGW